MLDNIYINLWGVKYRNGVSISHFWIIRVHKRWQNKFFIHVIREILKIVFIASQHCCMSCTLQDFKQINREQRMWKSLDTSLLRLIKSQHLSQASTFALHSKSYLKKIQSTSLSVTWKVIFKVKTAVDESKNLSRCLLYRFLRSYQFEHSIFMQVKITRANVVLKAYKTKILICYKK